MKLARADRWDLVSVSGGSSWPWPDLDLPAAQVRQPQANAFKVLVDLLLRRQGKRRSNEPVDQRKSRRFSSLGQDRANGGKREFASGCLTS
jgi:hypothetical protein